MNRYRITYRSGFNGKPDPGCPAFTGIWKGYGEAHAIERFWEADDSDPDWVIERVEIAR